MADSDKSDSSNQVVHIHYVHHIHHYPGVPQYPGAPQYPGMATSMPGQPHKDVMVSPGFYAPKAPEKSEE